jgi:hypothetical protein
MKSIIRMKTNKLSECIADVIIYVIASLLVAISFFAVIVGEGNKGLLDLF